MTVVTVVTSSRCDAHLPGLPGLPGRGEAVKRRSRAVCKWTKWTKWTKSTESSTQMQPELRFLHHHLISRADGHWWSDSTTGIGTGMTDVAELCTQTYKESRPVDVLPRQGLMYLASWSTIRPRQLQTVASTVCKVNRFSMLKDAIRNPPSTKCRASFYAMESRGSWECVSGWMCQCCDVSIPCLRLFSSRILSPWFGLWKVCVRPIPSSGQVLPNLCNLFRGLKSRLIFIVPAYLAQGAVCHMFAWTLVFSELCSIQPCS